MARGDVSTKKPTTRTLDYGAAVRNAWGDAWHAKDVVYEFSSGRQFKDPAPNGGPYNGTNGNG
jgi:hypothetical protein